MDIDEIVKRVKSHRAPPGDLSDRILKINVIVNIVYQNIKKFENIMKAFDTVCKNTKNKRKVSNFKTYKCIYVNQIYRILNNKEYKVGKYILEPALLPCLIDANVASRKNII